MIDGDELCQHLVELPGKILPRRIDRRGQRKEGVCQVDLPVACGRQELIVHDRRLLLELHGARLADHLGRELFQIARIARELGADGLLKFGRLLRADGKDRRKTELTDHLDQLALAIENTLRCRKHSQDSFLVWAAPHGLSSAFGGPFPPIHRFEKWDIHKVCPHFPKLDSTKNLSPKVLDKPRGTALNLFYLIIAC